MPSQNGSTVLKTGRQIDWTIDGVEPRGGGILIISTYVAPWIFPQLYLEHGGCAADTVEYNGAWAVIPRPHGSWDGNLETLAHFVEAIMTATTISGSLPWRIQVFQSIVCQTAACQLAGTQQYFTRFLHYIKCTYMYFSSSQ